MFDDDDDDEVESLDSAVNATFCILDSLWRKTQEECVNYEGLSRQELFQCAVQMYAARLVSKDEA